LFLGTFLPFYFPSYFVPLQVPCSVELVFASCGNDKLLSKFLNVSISACALSWGTGTLKDTAGWGLSQQSPLVTS
jgi:hypothetical protein